MIGITGFAVTVASCMFATAAAAGAAAPAALVALTGKAKIPAPISTWCAGGFQPGVPQAYAIAVPRPQGGGRYLVLGVTDAVIELAAFSGSAELACYSAAEAKRLSSSIAKSEAIEGGIAPVFNTTVVCGFLDNTSAECWQYDPATCAFVKVGGWMT